MLKLQVGRISYSTVVAVAELETGVAADLAIELLTFFFLLPAIAMNPERKSR